MPWSAPAIPLIGVIPAHEIAQLSGGRMAQPVTVSLNRLIFDYDQIVICGPVFPHEVVGFSGGNKISSATIAKSSGHDVLDQVALETVRQTSPITLSQPLEKSSVTMQIPLGYYLDR